MIYEFLQQYPNFSKFTRVTLNFTFTYPTLFTLVTSLPSPEDITLSKFFNSAVFPSKYPSIPVNQEEGSGL